MQRTLAATGLAAALLLVSRAGPVVPAEPVRLVMPVVYGTHLPGLGEPAARLAKLVQQLSDGELEVKQPGDRREILDRVAASSAP